MDWTHEVRRRFHQAGRDVPADDIVVELAEHAEDLAADLRARGLQPEAVATRVADTIGQWVASPGSFARHRSRRAAVAPPAASPALLPGLVADLRYSVRVLARQPAPALLAVFTIAVGVGAVTLMAGLAWSILYKPLPWPHGDRLVRLVETRQGAPSRFGPYLTNASWLAWRDRASTVDALGAWRTFTVTLGGERGGAAERVATAQVTTGIETITGATPHLGRLLTADDERVGAARVVLLSYDTWTGAFGGRPDIVGRPIRLNGEPYTVVGVLEKGCVFPNRRTALWLPLAVAPVVAPGVEGHQLSFFHAIARLKPGVTAAQAAAEATARARTAPDPGLVLVAAFGNRGPAAVLADPALESMTREARPGLLVMFAAVLLLLACAVANVANVQLTRAAARRRDLGIRAALGAGTRRLVRQLNTEHVLLGIGGGAVGLAMAWAAFAAVPPLLPAGTPRLEDLSFDWPVAAVAFLCAAGAGMLVGIFSAWHVGRLDLVQTIAEDGLAPTGTSTRLRSSRLRSGVMVAQVAAAAVLLVGGVLLTRSFLAVTSIDRGFDSHGVLTATIPLPAIGYSADRSAALVGTLAERVRQVPGVRAVGITSVLPLSGSEMIRAFTLPPRHGSATPVMVQAAFRVVSPSYFSALGLRVSDGRALNDTDTATSRRVVVVNRAFARAYLDSPAVGRTMPAGKDDLPWEVVGVVDVVRGVGGTLAPLPELLVSYAQWPDGMRTGDPSIAVRTVGRPEELAPVLRGLLRDLDPELALADVRTMESKISEIAATPRLYSIVVGTFAGLALLIAGVGLFGVLSYVVAQRSRELAVRAALGAGPAQLVGMVVRQATVVVALGIAIGFGVTMALGDGLSAVLYGVSTHDLAAYLGAAGLLLSVGALASLLPAARAARLDPMALLRRG
jgi:putative ABC transport system permease protein